MTGSSTIEASPNDSVVLCDASEQDFRVFESRARIAAEVFLIEPDRIAHVQAQLWIAGCQSFVSDRSPMHQHIPKLVEFEKRSARHCIDGARQAEDTEEALKAVSTERRGSTSVTSIGQELDREIVALAL